MCEFEIWTDYPENSSVQDFDVANGCIAINNCTSYLPLLMVSAEYLSLKLLFSVIVMKAKITSVVFIVKS